MAVDLKRYAACEIQKIVGTGERRLVRLNERPMHVNRVLPWLVEHGFVERVPEPCYDPNCGNEECRGPHGVRFKGWGTSYCAAPWDRAVPR